MIPDDDCVFETIGFLATLSARFNELRITASKHPAVRATSVPVLPVKGQRTGDYADNGVVVSVAVNLELVAPKDRDKRVLGASLLFRRSLGVWFAEAEVGWTGSRIRNRCTNRVLDERGGTLTAPMARRWRQRARSSRQSG